MLQIYNQQANNYIMNHFIVHNIGSPKDLHIPESDNRDISEDIYKHLYLCHSGEFIWEIYECDGTEHCQDGSDERNCE